MYKMLIVHDLNDWKAPWKACTITLGVFDGLHRGHRKILERLQKRSHKNKYPRVLLTYHPHPDFVLQKRKKEDNLELFTYEEKLSLLQDYNLDAVIFLPFTLALSRMTAIRYLKEILLEKLNASHIIIGYDQAFGRGRKGNYTFLKKRQHRCRFEIEQIGVVKYRNQIVSSTAIRKHLGEGKVKEARQLLGYDFFIRGMVKRGLQRGQKIGFPTANLDLSPSKVIPKNGVYAGLARWGEEEYKAMISIGNKPTFGDSKNIEVEAHLLHFKKELYGQNITVFFQEHIRRQIKFHSPQTLAEQLAKDQAFVESL